MISLPAHRAACGGRFLSLSLFAAAAAMAADAAVPSVPDATTTQAQIDDLRRANAALTARLDGLERKAATPSATSGHGVRLVELSLDVLTAAGGSTADNEEIAVLNGGGHDPKRRGFTFQGAELSIAGAVDPFFTAEMHAVLIREEPTGETGIELEEAFARSTCLPGGLELKVGHYLTEFGRFNAIHPHAWAFINQPIILGRVFGGDGMRTPGARMLWSAPTPWLSELIVNVQNAEGATAPSFMGVPGEGGIGGHPSVAQGNGPALLYSVRWSNAFDVGEDTMVKLGLSAARGPNAGGVDTATTVWGADAVAKWHPAGGSRGWPFVTTEVEYLERRYDVDGIDAFSVGGDGIDGTADDVTSTAPSGTLVDRGIVLQAVWGFVPAWSVGMRYEYATGSGDSITVTEDANGEVVDVTGRLADSARDNRQRWSGLVGWQPSEFTHMRLQYDHDQASHLDRVEHSVWLGIEFLIGTHPAHLF